MHWGPSIKYVTLFLNNSYPLPLSHFVTHPGTPKSMSHISDPPFLLCLVQKRNPCTNSINCSREFLSGGPFVWKVLSGMVFVRSLFCQNTSVTTEIKHYFKFQVSCV